MKALTCEMCGSTNLIKKDGVFVCQSCGTQYSVEEAKKMMVEGTVDVKGTVKVDTSDELKNLYELARRAKDSDNSENAAKYYDMILVKDPQSWEANFYSLYFHSMMDSGFPVKNVYNSYSSIIKLIKRNNTEDEQESFLREITDRVSALSSIKIKDIIATWYKFDTRQQTEEDDKYVRLAFEDANILLSWGDTLYSFDKDKYRDVILDVWKKGVKNIVVVFKSTIRKDVKLTDAANLYGKKIKQLDPSYTAKSYSPGCYVATAVYGSYDCPQVWTLRRYRDYTLAETWFGRAFIKTYYATSPTMVKWFGKTSWFKSIGKKLLDKKVQKLNEEGVSDLQYDDRQW